ncbi:MAG: FAD:protein FMN transferase [Woeseiaceae bacterium]
MSARLIIPLLFLLLSACAEQRSGTEIHELTGQTMGTSFSIKLVAPEDDFDKALLAERVHAILNRVNSRMSTWQSDSELSLFNANASTDWIDTSAEFCGVLESALAISNHTAGAFDITVGPFVNLWGFGPDENVTPEPPSDELITGAGKRVGYRKLQTDCGIPAVRKSQEDVYIDLSAIAKGYAVDQIANELDERGLANYLIEIGGELRMRGHNASDANWAIAIEKPADLERAVQLIVNLTNQAMATSGDYRNFFEFRGERFSHTIDSRTGRPVTHRGAAVTVISKSAAEADALATALLVLGPEAGYAFAEKERIAAYFLLRDESRIEEKMTSTFAALQKT